MKNLKILFLLFPNLIFCQKFYEIGKTAWIYNSPDYYIYKADNFSDVAEVGKKVLGQQENLNFSPEEKILFSIAKDNESTHNIIFSSYLSNANIQKFGFEIYSEKLMEIFRKTFNDLKIEANISKEKVKIDTKEFYLIKCDIKKPREYKNYFFFTEIDNKELQITTIFDNQTDENLILHSIYDSKFK